MVSKLMSSITAIIPTYNRADYLDKAIISVKKQTKSVDELIIVDDGSTDDTQKVVESHKRGSFNITYVQQNNRGPAAARNTGIKKASHSIIAFLDSDDTWQKRKIEIQVKGLQENRDYLISHTSEKWLRRGVHLNRKKKHLQKHGDIFFQNLSLCAAGMSTIMVRKELFDYYGLFDENFLCCEDYEFWLRIGAKENFLLIDRPLTVKHGGRDDQVSSIYRMGMDTYRIAALEKNIQSKEFSHRKRSCMVQECIRRCTIYANGCGKHGQTEDEERYIAKLNQLKKMLVELNLGKHP